MKFKTWLENSNDLNLDQVKAEFDLPHDYQFTDDELETLRMDRRSHSRQNDNVENAITYILGNNHLRLLLGKLNKESMLKMLMGRFPIHLDQMQAMKVIQSLEMIPRFKEH